MSRTRHASASVASLVVLALIAGAASASPARESQLKCKTAPAALRHAVKLPRSIPHLQGIVYTHATGSGTSMDVTGYLKTGNLRTVMRTYTNGLRKANFSTSESHATKFAEIQFYNAKLTGTIDLTLSCAQRTTVHLNFHSTG